jgi:asparagine synthase (glutamine-hydrolysing)
MCGICGIYNIGRKGSIDDAVLYDMMMSLHHRGPDSHNMSLKNNIGFGHTRLSIIDLSTGSQPIANEDGSIMLILNGEIYNYKELRESLIKRGHRFKSDSDTEVIVHAYETYGIQCIEHFVGMFAFALWDTNKKSLFLVRDRLGKKPLYYLEFNGVFYFSSEIKAFLKIPDYKCSLNFNTLEQYSIFSYCVAPNTILKNIYKLRPGFYLERTENTIKETCYWHCTYNAMGQMSYDAAKHKVRDQLTQAVQSRMISDVPLGAFLSGGIDSSIIVAIMSQLSSTPIKTFSIGFNEERYSELSFARCVAKAFKTEHYEKIVTPDIHEILDHYIWSLDQPFADSSSIAMYYLAKMARQHITVALSGDGGDETFAGYPRYKGILFYSFLKQHKQFRKIVHSLLKIGSLYKNRNSDSKSFLIKINKFYLTLLSDQSLIDEYNNWFSHFKKKELNELFVFFPEYDSLESIHDYYKSSTLLLETDKVIYTDINSYLPDDLLFKADSMSMAHSLEVRSPFLDHRFFDYSLSLPLNFKLSFFNSKKILKDAFAHTLPRAIVNRRKMGFGVPVSQWIRNELLPLVSSIFDSSEFKDRGIYNHTYAEKLLREHCQGYVDNGYKIWNIFIFELWCQKFLDGKKL